MKFRPLGVALVAGSSVTLAALAASPAVALDDNSTLDKPIFGDKPYPPVTCSGQTGSGTVSKSVVLTGESVVFSGCGFVPFTTIQIEVNGTVRTTTIASGTGTFSEPLNFPDAGQQHLAAIGEGLLTTGTTIATPVPPVTDPPLFGSDEPESDAPVAGSEPGLFDEPVLIPDLDLDDPAPAGSAATTTAPAVAPATGTVAAPPVINIPAVEPSTAGSTPAAVIPPKITQLTRIVSATVLVIGFGADGIEGLPISTGWIPGLVEHLVKNADEDEAGAGAGAAGDRNCFGGNNGVVGDKDEDGKDDKVDKEDKDDWGNWGDWDKKEPQASELNDDKVGEDKVGEDKDEFKDDKDEFKDDKDKDKDGKDGLGGAGVPCVVAGVGVGVVGGGVGGAGVAPGGGALPFTGVETGALASIAVALLGGGALLRVASRRRRLTGATGAVATQTEV